MQTRKRIITIAREIHTDDKRLMEMIDESINYRRKIYNMCVEYIRNNDYVFSSKALYEYIREFEKSDDVYDDRPVGIRAMTLRDIRETVNKIWKHRKSGVPAKLNFRRYNPYEGSFKVENKGRKDPWTMTTILSPNTIKFKANSVKDFIKFPMHHYTVRLKEPIVCGIDLQNRMYDKTKRYRFSNSDIREVGFYRKNKKYYIIIVVEVEFILKSDGFRKPLAGLDLGIHNPIVMYDGHDFGKYRFSKKVLARLEYLEKRASKLQTIMDRKYCRNKELGLNPYSKNYEKVRYKYRRTWEKINNIRRDWRYKLAHAIVTKYDCIVVDKFRQPDNSDKPIGSENKTKMNHSNRLHAMSKFMRCLEYMAYKYGCEFIDAPSGTTRTCSECGYVNDKLPLHKRKLKCGNCGTKIDRDENAAKNCYMYGLAR